MSITPSITDKAPPRMPRNTKNNGSFTIVNPQFPQLVIRDEREKETGKERGERTERHVIYNLCYTISVVLSINHNIT